VCIVSQAPGLFSELKRRNVFRVGAAYLVVGWLMIEVADTVFPRLGLPDWTVTFVIALLMLGLPVALFFAWAFELTPEGVKRTEAVSPAESVTPHTGRAIDKLILVGMVVVVAVIVADRFLLKESAQEGLVPATEQVLRSPAEDAATMAAPVVDAPAMASAPAAVDAAPPVAAGIAVLPFVNMSPDPENAYFADGISEELLNILAGVEGLKVASRTSAFSFKGKDTPIPEIARQLGVRHVLEGSVRKQGQRVRITAQLIEAGNDAHLWSQTYERELVDIFRVQEEIAVAITTALEDILGTRRVSVEAPTGDLEAYESFLRGRSLFYQRFELDRAIDDLQAAVDRDPGFAEAWAFLGAATSVVASGGYLTDRDPAVLMQRSDQAIARALALNPGIPIALAGQGRGLIERGQVAEGLAMLEEAARQAGPDTSPRLWLGISLAELGYVDRALPWFESAHAQDPLVPLNHGYLGYAYAVVGREEEGVRLAYRAVELNPRAVYWSDLIGIEAASRGDLERAREMLALVRLPADVFAAMSAALADPGLRKAFIAAQPRENASDYHVLVGMSLYLRDAESLFDAVRQTSRSGENMMRFAAWLPSLGWLREDPRFYEFMRESGTVAYWEANDYPRGCRPVDDPAGRRLDCSEHAP
jgi:TolB-like protein/Flp pilus assembly protein TadD